MRTTRSRAGNGALLRPSPATISHLADAHAVQTRLRLSFVHFLPWPASHCAFCCHPSQPSSHAATPRSQSCHRQPLCVIPRGRALARRCEDIEGGRLRHSDLSPCLTTHELSSLTGWRRTIVSKSYSASGQLLCNLPGADMLAHLLTLAILQPSVPQVVETVCYLVLRLLPNRTVQWERGKAS